MYNGITNWNLNPLREKKARKYMSKTDLNKVDRSKFLEIATAAGLTVTEQSAFAKLTFGDSPARIYVAKTKNVTRVDLSGFSLKRDGVTQVSRDEAKELKLGAVQAQLDFTQDEETVLAAFTKVCEALKEVPAKEKKAPKVKAKTETTETEAGESEPVEVSTSDRRNMIVEAAKKQQEAPAEADQPSV